MKMRIIKGLALLTAAMLWLSGCQGINPGRTEDSEKEHNSSALSVIPDFSLSDMQGNVVTGDVFKDYDYTIVNVWATSCSPCIEELPLLQNISKEQAVNRIGVIGIVADGMGAAPQANEMLQTLGISFVNLLPDENFQEQFIGKQSAVPYTMIVDQNGNILKFVMGSQTELQFQKMIGEILN